jgi:outer membrane usher protein FimD/PapC
MSNNKATAKVELPVETKQSTASKGNYVCLSTKNIKGMRLNLDSLESYGPSGDTTINLSRASGKITVEFDSRTERDELLARLDGYCL